jgi:hypothetical protein
MNRLVHNLEVHTLPGEDTWKDIVRIKKEFRRDTKGNHIKRGTICRITVEGNSKWVVIHGRETDDPVIQMDLNVRLGLGLEKGKKYDFAIEKLSLAQRIWFPWRASDPIYRIPAQLGLISFLLGTVLGLVGVILGVVALKH